MNSTPAPNARMAAVSGSLADGLAARRSGVFARSLAIGFGSAVSMWVVAYVAMMNPGLVVGEALFGLTLSCALVGGLIAGRNAKPGECGWSAGAKAAFVTATLNMLLIGSLVGGADSESSRDKMIQFIMWMAGNYGITIVLGMVGGMLAATGSPSRSVDYQSRNWFSVFTRVAAVTVLLLLITGGLVTGLEAGLAVTDWPTSFGHNMLLYPLSEMKEGVYYEHAHRLYGMLVGVTAIALAISAFFLDERKWLRGLAVGYLTLVCVQGYLGGTRVTETSVPLAIIHGIFGQIVFASACAIAAVTSPTWIGDCAPSSRPSAQTDRTWTLVLVFALLMQLALGAMYRHKANMHVLYTHILWAAFVTGFAIFAGVRAASKNADLPVIPRLGRSMLHTVGLQIALGIVAMIAVLARPAATPVTAGDATPIERIPLWEIVFTTAHQATGALLLALATMLMLWTRRLVRVTSYERRATSCE